MTAPHPGLHGDAGQPALDHAGDRAHRRARRRAGDRPGVVTFPAAAPVDARDRRPRRHRARCRRRRRSDRRAHRHRPRHHPRRAHDHGRVHRRRRRPRRLPPGDVVRTDVGRQRGPRALCADVGVDVGPVDTGPTLTAYVADPTRSALDHIARLAAWSGALASIDGDGRVTTRVVDGAQPDVALRHDREVLRISQRTVAGRQRPTSSPARRAPASAAPPDAARPTSDFFAGDRPDGPGVGTRWSFEPALRTPDAAAVAGAARGRTAGSLRHRTTLDAWLVPALRPGTVVRLDELPDGLAAGPHWVERVVHRVGTGRRHHVGPARRGGCRLRPARPARLARRRGREPAVSGTNVPLLVQTVRGLAHDEVLARWTTAAAVVRSVHGGAEHALHRAAARDRAGAAPSADRRRRPRSRGPPERGRSRRRRLQRRRRARRRGRRAPVRRDHGAARPRPRPGRVEPARRRDRRRLPPPADGRRARRRDSLGRR